MKLPDTYQGIGSLVGKLTSFYDSARYRENAPKNPLPPFLAEAIGPPLMQLHSYNISDTRNPISKSTGFGKALNTTHREMINMGFRIASFVFPDVIERTANGKLINAYKAIGFKGIDVKIEGTDTKLHLDQDLARDILLLGAITQGFMTRPGDENELIDNKIGNAEVVFSSMRGMRNRLIYAIDEQKLQNHVKIQDFMLNAGKIRDAFTERAQDLVDARLFIQMAHGGILTDDLRDACWQQNEPYPEKNKTVAIYNPKDAACAMFSLGYYAKDGTSQELHAAAHDLSERLARCPDHAAAARLINLPEYRNTMDALHKQIPNDSRQALLQSAVAELENYRDKHYKTSLATDQIQRGSPEQVGEHRAPRPPESSGHNQVGA